MCKTVQSTLSRVLTAQRYNSTIFSSSASTNYLALLVTQEFFEGAPFRENVTYLGGSIDNRELIGSIQKSGREGLTRFENKECYETFATPYVPGYLSVALVTNVTTAESSLLEVRIHSSTSSAGSTAIEQFKIYGRPFDVDNWLTNYYPQLPNSSRPDYRQQPTKVEYCLARSVDPECTVELFPALLWTVIICNLVKVACFVALLYIKFTPLITTGDAVASFLTHPDATTERLGPFSARDARGQWVPDMHGGRYWKENPRRVEWKAKRYYWFRGASKTRWFSTALV